MVDRKRSKLQESLNSEINKTGNDGAALEEGQSNVLNYDQAFENAKKQSLDLGDENAPEQLEPEKVVAPSKQKKKASKAGVGALVLSIVAVGLSGYTFIRQAQDTTYLNNRNSSQDDTLQQIALDSNTLIGQVEDIINQQADYEGKLTKMDNLVSSLDIEGIQAFIDRSQSRFELIESRITGAETDLGEYQTKLNGIEKSFTNIKTTKPVATTRSVVKKTRTVATKKVAPTTNDVEGAYIASIDIWGDQTSLMLRDTNGQWIPLIQGDSHKGWVVRKIESNGATFQKGSRSKRLVIKE